MKNIFVKYGFLTAAAMLFTFTQACNQTEKKKNQVQTELNHEVHNNDEAHNHDEAHKHDEVHSHGEIHGAENHTADRLTLNNGEKWLADEPTNKNAKIIISIGDQFLENDNRTLEDYQAFGDDISEAINTMIRECTMKGEADMALHFWFAPILQHANTLKNATDTMELSEITLDMVDRMRIYNDYFAQS